MELLKLYNMQKENELITKIAAINAAIEAVDSWWDGVTNIGRQKQIEKAIMALPSAESELENKIRAIGYTGKEGRIYIGGRLFAVRELPQ